MRASWCRGTTRWRSRRRCAVSPPPINGAPSRRRDGRARCGSFRMTLLRNGRWNSGGRSFHELRSTLHDPRSTSYVARGASRVRATCNVQRVTRSNDQSPPRPRSPPRALALDGSLRPPAARLAGEHRSGIRGAAGSVDRGPDARPGERAKRARLVHILDHSYAHMVTRVQRRPAIVTVHDLMPVIILRSPTDGWREGVRNRFLRGTLKALRLARSYIVGTEWLKRELATWLGDDRRISVVPFGVDRAFFSEAPNARVRGRADWRIPNDAFVVLHVGSTVERKNVPLVIHTVARLRAEADAYLLQVGGRFSNDQQQLIERLGLRRFVRTAPLADESTLRRAYRAADVLLFPSLYEGFGYPVIEAFASGLPVVTSGAGGLKEVGGDAIVVVEGRDPAAYVAALESLSDDPLRREELVERGRALARTFTWQRTAEQTADVYRSLL